MTYGQGEYGGGPAAPDAAPNPNSGQWSFGRKIEPGMTQVLYDDAVVPYEAQRDILDNFYRTWSKCYQQRFSISQW